MLSFIYREGIIKLRPLSVIFKSGNPRAVRIQGAHLKIVISPTGKVWIWEQNSDPESNARYWTISDEMVHVELQLKSNAVIHKTLNPKVDNWDTLKELVKLIEV